MALCGGVVPFEIAEKMPPWQLLGFNVIAGELKGGKFDWDRMEWSRRDD